MKIVNRKTRKAIRKGVKKAIKKHGPKIAAGLAGGVASTLATLASTEAPGTKGKQSNLDKVSNRVSEMIAGDGGKKRKRVASARTVGKKAKRGKKSPAQTEAAERTP